MSDRFYRFALLDELGTPDPDNVIALPSVTTILDVLSKPALYGWYWKTTVEGVSKLLEQDGLKGATVDELKGMLKARALRPYDLRDSAADRGTNAHDYLEGLAKGLITPTEILADEQADGYARGVARWWTERQPQPLASEVVVRSLRYGFAGRFDLIYQNGNARVVLADLKTSKAVWTEAHLQLAAYKLAWEEMHPDRKIDRTMVLRTNADGQYEETSVDADPELFCRLIDVWHWQREKEAAHA